MICASARAGDDQGRRSSTASHHHHNSNNHQHNGSRGTTAGNRRQGNRKKAEEVPDEQQRKAGSRRKQSTTQQPHHHNGKVVGKAKQGGAVANADEEGSARDAGGRKKGAEWEAWERRVRGGVVSVDDALRKTLTRREGFEALYQVDPKPIATGMFTNIKKCRSKASGKEYAAKFSLRNRCGTDCTAEIYHEVALLSIVAQCPHVVHLCDIFETPQEIILVLEYAPGGDLQSIIDDNMVPFESDVVDFVRIVLEGLEYIHKNNIAHLDIKPQNLVMMGAFPDCDIKLCDFEISRAILPGESIKEILGTPDYVAPEILHYEPLSTAADMWSLGVTTYVLLTGFSPFGGDTDQETFCNIAKAQLDFPEELFEDVSQQAKDFITRLLVRDPSSRPTASECLKHPWISQQSNHTSGPSGRRYLSVSAAPSPAVSCRDLTLLRRHLSKSREALYERVASSNFRKALSRSRDRLCGSHLSLVARSRDTLYDSPTTAARRRSRDELSTLLSRSHEALALRDCLQKIGARPLAGFYGSMIDTNVSQGLEPENQFMLSKATSTATNSTSLSNGNTSPVSSTADDSVREDATEDSSDSEGTLREEDGSARTTPDDVTAKICDSDGESDRERASGGDETQTKGAEQRSEAGQREGSEDERENSKDNANCTSGTASTANELLEETMTCGEDESEADTEEEPRYTVAQLISVFNKRMESSRKIGVGRPPPISLPTMPEDTLEKEEQPEEGRRAEDEGRSTAEDSEVKERVGEEEEGNQSTTVQYLRSGSLSSETSGYETPSDASSMASWEEGITKQAKSLSTEKEVPEVSPGSHATERRSSTQGPLFHHTWGMKVCDGSYNRAMSRFGNVERGLEHKGRACKPQTEQAAERSHRKCKPLVKPFL
ncbi:serine/threonine-protein kinase MARK2-like [Ischnura elegans]|uniref:serine/threonine-protein kinase MARK2-like n=1 Tax=Ischnura elegans TaxID=197161 RepID=UPI001ED8785F|nr:serine/threonine-protein kinase MARK2-like [Ischnura elegans]